MSMWVAYPSYIPADSSEAEVDDGFLKQIVGTGRDTMIEIEVVLLES